MPAVSTTTDIPIEGRPQVSLAGGEIIDAGAVVLTSGLGTFTPRPLPAGEEFLGKGLSYFVPDPSVHADQDMLVVGGGDSAVDWALTLHPIAKSITLVHRRGTFRAHAASVAAVTESRHADCHRCRGRAPHGHKPAGGGTHSRAR